MVFLYCQPHAYQQFYSNKQTDWVFHKFSISAGLVIWIFNGAVSDSSQYVDRVKDQEDTRFTGKDKKMLGKMLLLKID